MSLSDARSVSRFCLTGKFLEYSSYLRRKSTICIVLVLFLLWCTFLPSHAFGFGKAIPLIAWHASGRSSEDACLPVLRLNSAIREEDMLEQATDTCQQYMQIGAPQSHFRDYSRYDSIVIKNRCSMQFILRYRAMLFEEMMFQDIRIF